MKSMNRLIEDYTRLLQPGEIQAAYKGILEFIGRLRADFIKKFAGCDIGGIYPGYMDMTYFSLIPAELKEKGLKVAVVYLHSKGCFEAWLSARNRKISKRYESVFCDNMLDKIAVFHNDSNKDAIIELTLASSPDFEDQRLLTETIERGTKQFVTGICAAIAASNGI